MKRLGVLGILLLAIGVVHADENRLTTLTSSGASVSYTATKNAHLALQCDAAAYYVTGAGSATASATAGVLIAANAPPYDVWLTGSSDTVAIISVSGTANCKVFRVYP